MQMYSHLIGPLMNFRSRWRVVSTQKSLLVSISYLDEYACKVVGLISLALLSFRAPPKRLDAARSSCIREHARIGSGPGSWNLSRASLVTLHQAKTNSVSSVLYDSAPCYFRRKSVAALEQFVTMQ